MKQKKLLQELEHVPPEMHQLYRAVRQMNTFVCEQCYSEELCTHPTLGDAWSPEWYLAMTELAHAEGWVANPPPTERATWFFKEFQLVGPNCARAAAK